VELIAELTLVILLSAALVFLFQLLIQKKARHPSASSFSTVLLLMLIGWIATEVTSDLAGQILGEIGRIAHFLVMIMFAATITYQLRRSSTH